MKIINKIQAIALCGLAGLFTYTTASSAEEILVNAGPGIQWVAFCDRCEEQGPNVNITVEPGDIIVFRQNDPGSRHGIVGVPAELAKITRREEVDNTDKIAVELEAPTMFGVEDFQKIEFPVEITRIEIKDNYAGSLILICNVHGFNMTVTLERD